MKKSQSRVRQSNKQCARERLFIKAVEEKLKYYSISTSQFLTATQLSAAKWSRVKNNKATLNLCESLRILDFLGIQLSIKTRFEIGK